MVTEAVVEVSEVVIVKFADVPPALTVTDAGRAAGPAVLVSVTIAPPVGAGPVSTIFPVTVVPWAPERPMTFAELKVRAWSAVGDPGLTVRVAVRVAPYLALMVTARGEATPLVTIVKPTEVAPEETVTIGGTAATAGSLLETETIAPAEGAGAERVIVPVAFWQQVTALGLSVSEEASLGVTLSVTDVSTPA